MASGETSREAIADQAAEWLVRFDAGRGDPEAFQQWRDADPRHAAVFAQIAATWQKTTELRTGNVDPEAEVAPPEEPAPALSAGPGPWLSRRSAMTALAGAAVVATGAGALLWDRRAYAETGVGERCTVRLPDGSRAELNTDSRIAWQLGNRLEFWLDRGEAAIIVAQASNRAVLARLASLRAELLDGSYNLRLRGEAPTLVTFSGQARVTDGRGVMTIVMPGHALTDEGAGLGDTALSAAQLDRARAWQRGEIIFDGMTLASALAEFNRYLPTRLELADPSIATLRLGGRFNTDDPQAFLQALHDGFGIGSRADEGRILLFRKNNLT